METIEARNVIVGAGIMGAMAAYHLAKRGESVLLVEQFALDHDRGSSHGAARITRHSYADRTYAQLMPWAFRAWRDFEADAGESVYIRTGGVSFAPAGSGYTSAVATNLADLGVPAWRGTGREWNARHPVFSLPDDADVVFEPDAGLLAADRARALAVGLARSLGGDRTAFFEHTPIRRIDLDGEKPVVVGDALRIVADRLIVAAGPWVERLIAGLPRSFAVTRQQVLYLRPRDADAFRIGRFPVFISKGFGPDDAFYGMPSFLGRGVKVARHGGPATDPDIENRKVDAAYVELVRGFLEGTIPALLAGADFDRSEVCLYTADADEQFLIDRVPDRADVIVASPCSGHGFKFSCMIGKVLADLAVEGKSLINPLPWRWRE